MITAPAPRHAVERDVETSPANAVDVEIRYRKDTFDVSLQSHGHPSSISPSSSHVARGIPSLDQRAHLDRPRRLEEQARRADELERVPLDGVVARGDHQAAGGMVVLDGELAGRRRREPDVDDVAADRLERGEDDAMEHRAGDAAVAADDDFARPGDADRARQRPGAERRGVARDDFRRERFADAPADARHADHQSVVSTSAAKPSRRARKGSPVGGASQLSLRRKGRARDAERFKLSRGINDWLARSWTRS